MRWATERRLTSSSSKSGPRPSRSITPGRTPSIGLTGDRSTRRGTTVMSRTSIWAAELLFINDLYISLSHGFGYGDPDRCHVFQEWGRRRMHSTSLVQRPYFTLVTTVFARAPSMKKRREMAVASPIAGTPPGGSRHLVEPDPCGSIDQVPPLALTEKVLPNLRPNVLDKQDILARATEDHPA